MYTDNTGNKSTILLQGQPLIHAKFKMGKKPQQLVLNGQKAEPVYKDGMLLLDIDNEK